MTRPPEGRVARSALPPTIRFGRESEGVYVCGECTMTRLARLAILVFGLLALLATPAAGADPPTPLRSPVRAAPRPAGPVRGRTSAYALRTERPTSSSRTSALGPKKQRALPAFAPLAAPSGIKYSLAKRRWLVFAILGTGIVFLTAVGSRQLYERLARTAPSGSSLRRLQAPPSFTRRCLLPGCHHSTHVPARRRSG
jgi:hypothetical protein